MLCRLTIKVGTTAAKSLASVWVILCEGLRISVCLRQYTLPTSTSSEDLPRSPRLPSLAAPTLRRPLKRLLVFVEGGPPARRAGRQGSSAGSMSTQPYAEAHAIVEVPHSNLYGFKFFFSTFLCCLCSGSKICPTVISPTVINLWSECLTFCQNKVHDESERCSC
jgi:hypothetical protein